MFKQNQSPEDTLRLLIEKAVLKGRSLQSPQTHFLHYFHHSLDEKIAQTIPTVENAYFILALMRTKTVEQIKEAKELLGKLLSFASEGNFPTYLHEYPECKDRYLGVHLLPIFYWILKDFQTILGKELHERLLEASKKLAASLIPIFEAKQPPYHLALKGAATWIAFGNLLKHDIFLDYGQSLLEQLKQLGMTKAWGNPHYLAEILASLQMIYTDLAASPWAFFWEYCQNTWHAATACYTGPSRKVFQAGFQPEIGLYDLYFAYFTGHLPARQGDGYPYELLSVFIQPHAFSLQPSALAISEKGRLDQQNWLMEKKPEYAYCFLENDPGLDPSHYNGYHFFRLLWGSPSFTHSFVCQKNKALTEVSCVADQQHIELSFLLEGEAIQDQGDLDGELMFFVDLMGGKVLVDGIPATTFTLANQLTLSSPSLSLTIKFVQENSEDVFFGHIHRGNRPAQILNKGLNRFEAYDLKIFIRPIKRTSRCRLKTIIHIETHS